jgi:hypothetical protein
LTPLHVPAPGDDWVYGLALRAWTDFARTAAAAAYLLACRAARLGGWPVSSRRQVDADLAGLAARAPLRQALPAGGQNKRPEEQQTN